MESSDKNKSATRAPGFTIWFTGLSGAGKTTLSKLVEARIRATGRNVEVLDGDVVRTNLSKGLGFSKEDRDTNILRIAFVAMLLTRNNTATIAAAISPYRETRKKAREQIGNFVEVFVKCPVEVCADRDTKGLYKKAYAGEIEQFTGVSDPYEDPETPEVIVETDKHTPEECADIIIRKLVEMGYHPGPTDDGYSKEDEEKIKKRLKNLGYM